MLIARISTIMPRRLSERTMRLLSNSKKKTVNSKNYRMNSLPTRGYSKLKIS